MSERTVYLLHFGRWYKYAGHYLGSTNDLGARLNQHARGQGARLLEVIAWEGIHFLPVRTWAGSRVLERQLKNRKEGPRLCPICRGRITGEEVRSVRAEGVAEAFVVYEWLEAITDGVPDRWLAVDPVLVEHDRT